MPNTHNTLAGLFSGVADAIRAKTGSQAGIVADAFPEAIAAIPTGGGAAEPERDVNFIDYDGTIVHSYTAAEFAELTALPANPSHDGLTAQGWNWSLADAQEYVADYGKLWVGQMYITDDGKTRIYIKLEEGRLSPHLEFKLRGTVDVDWGDGSAHDTSTKSQKTQTTFLHAYEVAGEYVITLSINGEITIAGDVSNGSRFLKDGISISAYSNALQKIEIGNFVEIGEYAFGSCYSLASITMPDSIASIGQYAFSACRSLACVTIPNSISTIRQKTFDYCNSLKTVSLPNTITTFESALNYCRTLASITIPNSVTSFSSHIFQYCESLKYAAVGGNSISAALFLSCGALTKVIAKNGIENIDSSAFLNCSSLVSITIPDSVAQISNSVFSGCTSLGYVKFENATPPVVSSSNAFNNVKTDCVFYVPRGSLEAYTTATNYPSSSTFTYVEYDP